MGLLKKRFRSQLFNAFQRWYREHRSTLPYRLTVKRATQQYLALTISGIDPALYIVLNKRSINVVIEWKGEMWDMLLSDDLKLARAKDYYYCELCTWQGEPERFATREALWEDHLFTPLLDWLTQRLASANFLVLTKYAGGSTAAKLAATFPGTSTEEDVVVVPLHRALGAQPSATFHDDGRF